MLNFDFKKLEFKFNDEQYELEYPTVKKINHFRKELKKKDADEVDVIIAFLCELGAKKEVIESLRVTQLNALIEELTNEQLLKKS
jgi:hypothetical protein